MKIGEDADMPFNFREIAIMKINSSKGGYNTEMRYNLYACFTHLNQTQQ